MANKQISIELANDGQALDILKLHYDAVHVISSKDYPEDVINEWSSEVNEDRVKKYLENPDNEIRLIAKINNKIVGFGALVLENNELRACYVSPYSTRIGVGKLLINEIENIAKSNGLNYLELDSSTTAEKFYLSCGYNIIGRDKHKMRNGMKMDCVKMEKGL